ncbi:putative short-chain dehydrogenase [Daldinia decipiens]|uniref:putative short-chain dehydrogenase n=1 Tax=Daldinia decipiens TaxID=326647 RepID=UPI0020C3FAEF|nr:putative short-chain dehydrogenase [Daldinia decipiens]KAI1659590.1 putative short-chain dehydrogenase [Daldinia decipiens]
MTATTHPEFNDHTEALDVAKAFAGEIHGKTVLVTGVNVAGIGFTTVQAFASQYPAHIILASRTPSKIQECIDKLKAEFPNVDYRSLILDLSTQRTVRAAAGELLSWSDIPTIDIIVNSAAIGNTPERTINEDGIEIQFATNHVGHFLFTCLIMPKLLKAAERNPKGATRIINVSSLSPVSARMRWSDLNFEKKSKELPEDEQPPYEMHRRWGGVDIEEKAYLPLEGYNQGKVANVLFSIALNKRLYEKYGILSISLHPGVISTELAREVTQSTRDLIDSWKKEGHLYFKTLGAGSATSLVAALDPKLSLPETKGDKENHGVYLIDCQISDRANSYSTSSEGAERLWNLSEDLVKEKFTW